MEELCVALIKTLRRMPVTTEELVGKVNDRLAELETLHVQVCHVADNNPNIHGIRKLARKVHADRQFLKQTLKTPEKLRPEHHLCNNASHLGSILSKCHDENYKVSAVFQPVRDIISGDKLTVELIADSGTKWIKVISQSVESLYTRWIVDQRVPHLLKQAHNYMNLAKANPVLFAPPQVIFDFMCGVPQPVSEKLSSIGVTILGKIVPVQQLPSTTLGIDFVGDSDSDSENEASSDFEIVDPSFQRLQVDTRNKYNLDLTALFAYVSQMTNGGHNYKFATNLLDEQAQFERNNPVKVILEDLFQDSDLIICETVLNSFHLILNTVGGQNETKRSMQFLERIKVVADHISQRTDSLDLSSRIKERSRVIFGCGDYYKAITVTANRGFVSAAQQQGISYAVFVHEARALSEKKQMYLLDDK